MWSPKTLFCPRALFSNANVIVESTPPLKNKRTFLSPASVFIWFKIIWRTVSWSQFFSIPQYFAKFSKSWFPHGVSFTSQWNWRLKRFFSRFWVAAKGQSFVEPITSNPSPGFKTPSWWLIQTCCSHSRPSKRGDFTFSFNFNCAKPNSPTSALPTFPL